MPKLLLDFQITLLRDSNRHLSDNIQPLEVSQNMPIEDGEFLSEPDVSEKMAGLLVAKALHVLYHPFPQLEEVCVAGEVGLEEKLAILTESCSSLDDIFRLTVAKTNIVLLRLNFVSS